VRRLLGEQRIENQQQLRELLRAAGYDVAQATVSRDLDAVGAVKVGRDHYVLGSLGDGAARMAELRRTMDQFARSVVASGRLVVIKVPPGAANLVAARIDGTAPDGVLGTVAGDDTIVVVTDGDGAAVAAALEGGGR
jgi:transcriptional regulator of arginine metabolism